MDLSHLCVENVAKLWLSKEIGEPMKRIVGSFGIAAVAQISNIKDLLKIILDPLEKAITLPALLMGLKMTKNASLGLIKNMSLLLIISLSLTYNIY